MICSMTGFGRAEMQDEERKIAIEIRSVNHRYLECGIRAPRSLHVFEPEFRTILKEYASRGKVDVFISYEDVRDSDSSVHVNELLVEQFLGYARELEEKYALPNDLTVSKVLTLPDVLRTTEEDSDEEATKKAVVAVLRDAAEQFRAARSAEGERLCQDLLAKLDTLTELVDKVEELEPAILEHYQERLREKTAELLNDVQIEESRIAAEVVIYSDKICTDEETVRLKSHIQQLREAIQGDGPIGRKLDFIVQEMNREANTILSKAGDMEIANIGVSLKTEIEKIREQVQNIE